MDKPSRPEPTLSIGALSRATGVAVETLRTWERRYGFPEPLRLPSGHRRYRPEAVDRLRLIRRALDMGHRPSTVVATDPDELRKLLVLSSTTLDSGDIRAPAAAAAAVDPGLLTSWVHLIERFDGAGLDQALEQAWARFGGRGFVTDCAVPTLHEVGRQWRSGRLSIAHEHFASERLRDYLAAQWRPLAAVARGPLTLLATLPGESHSLCLHLAAVILTMADARVILLGTDSPVEEIAATSSGERPAGVLIGISEAAAERQTVELLMQLRSRLDDQVTLLVGGPAYVRDVAGITTVEGYAALEPWARSVREMPSRPVEPSPP